MALAFSPALNNGFVNWDDSANFEQNFHFRGLGWEQIRWAFTTSLVGVYQPLAWLLLEAQYSVWALDPYGYHLTSLVLHGLNTLVLLSLAVAVVRRARAGGPGAADWRGEALCAVPVALFALHPLRVEVVAWASCQPYLVCGFFSLLSCLFYVQALGRSDVAGRRRRLALAILAMALAVLCKAVGAALTVELIILDAALRRGGKRRISAALTWDKAPFAVVSLITLGVAVYARSAIHQSPLAEAPTWGARVLQACGALRLYADKTLWPVGLANFYLRPAPGDLSSPWLVGALLFVAAVTVLLVSTRRRWPFLPLVALGSVVVLAPTLGFVQVAGSAAADRYTYAATAAPALALAVFLAQGSVRWRRRAWWLGGGILVAAVLGALCLATRAQCRLWHDSVALWTNAIARGADQSELAHNNLGIAYSERGDREAAAAEFRRAIALQPRFALAHANLGRSLREAGRVDAAYAEFAEAAALDPEATEALVGLGAAAFDKGDAVAARRFSNAALAQQPDSLSALQLLARAEVMLGDLTRARDAVDAILRFEPTDADAHNTRGIILLKSGDKPGAMREWEQAVRLQPEAAAAHLNLADALAGDGRPEAAVPHYAAAARAGADTLRALAGLGAALMQIRDDQQAAAVFAEVLRLDPQNAAAQANLELVRSRLNRGGKE